MCSVMGSKTLLGVECFRVRRWKFRSPQCEEYQPLHPAVYRLKPESFLDDPSPNWGRGSKGTDVDFGTSRYVL